MGFCDAVQFLPGGSLPWGKRHILDTISSSTTLSFKLITNPPLVPARRQLSVLQSDALKPCHEPVVLDTDPLVSPLRCLTALDACTLFRESEPF